MDWVPWNIFLENSIQEGQEKYGANVLLIKHVLINTLCSKFLGFECLKKLYPKDPYFAKIFLIVKNVKGGGIQKIDIVFRLEIFMVFYSKARDFLCPWALAQKSLWGRFIMVDVWVTFVLLRPWEFLMNNFISINAFQCLCPMYSVQK